MTKCYRKSAVRKSVRTVYVEKKTVKGVRVKRKDIPSTSSPSNSSPSKSRRDDSSVVPESVSIDPLRIPTTRKVDVRRSSISLCNKLNNMHHSLRMISCVNGFLGGRNSFMPYWRERHHLPEGLVPPAEAENPVGGANHASALRCSVRNALSHATFGCPSTKSRSGPGITSNPVPWVRLVSGYILAMPEPHALGPISRPIPPVIQRWTGKMTMMKMYLPLIQVQKRPRR
jgi:hypothetical protein